MTVFPPEHKSGVMLFVLNLGPEKSISLFITSCRKEMWANPCLGMLPGSKSCPYLLPNFIFLVNFHDFRCLNVISINQN